MKSGPCLFSCAGPFSEEPALFASCGYALPSVLRQPVLPGCEVMLHSGFRVLRLIRAEWRAAYFFPALMRYFFPLMINV